MKSVSAVDPAIRASGFCSVLFDGADAAQPSLQRAEPTCFRDLALDQIVAGATRGLGGYDLPPFFYTPLHEVAAVRYRQEVFHDLGDQAVRQAVIGFADGVAQARRLAAIGASLPDAWQRRLWLVAANRSYQDAVVAFARPEPPWTPNSSALALLRDHVADYAASERFRRLSAERAAVEESLASVRYCVHIDGLKVSVDRYRGEPDYGREVKSAFEKFRQGETESHLVEYGHSGGLNHVEANILALVAGLFPGAFEALRAYADQNTDFVDAVIGRFETEIRFYLGFDAYLRGIRGHGVGVCLPTVTREKAVRVRGAVDLALADKLAGESTRPVPNDLELGGPERMIVVTGANQGGKTTFARMFGQLHYLAALGCPVAASSAQLFLPDAIFTHFEVQEHVRTLRSKLENELVRIHDTIDRLTGESIVILNEVFTSATLEDASALGAAVLHQVVDRDAIGVCVTFLDEFSRLGPAMVSMVAQVDADDPAQRTFRLARRSADGLAHAMAIARRYGLTYEALTERIQR